MEAGTFVTTREFDNHMESIAKTQESIWRSLESQQAANATTSENIAVLTERLNNAIKAAAERDKKTDDRFIERDQQLADRDKRAWMLTVTVAGVVLTASIPYLVKGFVFIFGVAGF